MGKSKIKQNDLINFEEVFLEKENRRKKREITKQKKEKRNKKENWN